MDYKTQNRGSRRSFHQPLVISLVALEEIRATEEHSTGAAMRLVSEIAMTGIWTTPLLIDRVSMALMDGHHRFAAAKELGLALAPVILMSYEDDFVHLKAWRPGEVYTAEKVREVATSGRILPHKSTRHIFDLPLPACRVPLGDLRDPSQVGWNVDPATAHPTRIQILSSYYHAIGQRLAIRTLSASSLDVESPATIVPHTQMRQQLLSDPCMAALIAAAPCRVALGRRDHAPFRLINPDLLLLPPPLLAAPKALAVAARWGIEAAFLRRSHPFEPSRLPSLLRHGAALLHDLSNEDREEIMTLIPDSVASELIGSELEQVTHSLLAWIAELTGVDFPANLSSDGRVLDLDLPVERVLVSNGDSRIDIDPTTGKNKYGTTPRPRPEAVHFSSSTASSISDYGFLYCDVLRRDLLAHHYETGELPRDMRARLSDAIIAELADMIEIPADQLDGAIAPSGTDAEMLAVMVARAADPKQRLVNLLISPEETGRGVKLAGAGLFFDELAATGATISKGSLVWPDAKVDIVSLPVRDLNGLPLDIATMDKAFLKAGRKALTEGARVLAHQLVGSKTGLSAPSDDAIEILKSEAPDRVDVVVDACQMRLDFGVLGDMIRKGWMVQVSGSKALTGPPFAGALLLPTELRSRRTAASALLHPGVGYGEDWSAQWSVELPATQGSIDFGAPFRWLPALLEVQLWRRVAPPLRDHILERFAQEVAPRLEISDFFRLLAGETRVDGTGSDLFTQKSIIAFEIFAAKWDGQTQALGPLECRKMFEMLNHDVSARLPHLSVGDLALLRQEFHIGQPVEIGVEGQLRTVLRLVLGIRFYTIVGLAGPGAIAAALESEISDLVRAIDKLEILARNWWRLNG